MSIPTVTVTYEITGVTPLLMNNPRSLQQEGGITTKKRPDPEEEAETCAYRLPSGVLFVRAVGFKRGMVMAMQGFKPKGSRIGVSTIINRSLWEAEEECQLFDPSTKSPITEYVIDAQRAVIGSASVIRHRPRIDRWGCIVSFDYDPQFIDVSVISQALERAGSVSGLGDFRPEKGGRYGRYTAVFVSMSKLPETG